MRFANGALGSIVVSNSQNPGLWAKIHVHGYSGAAVGVQTDGGSMFVAGVTEEVEPPINDVWTVPGEEEKLAEWQAADRARASETDIMSHYHALQIVDFLDAIAEDREPMVTGKEGRKLVELVQAIYRSGSLRQAVGFPVAAEGPA
jgi:UDP-N-acetyl-2-amino-2-deoxyglucuronate dehydrogenase